MKKLLLFVFALTSVVSFAQSHDLSAKVLSPVDGQYLQAGNTFDYTVRIINSGTVPVTTSDSIMNFVIIDGSALGFFMESETIPVGDSVEVTRQLNLTGGAWGTWTFCGAPFVYTGETDSVNNFACTAPTWNPTISVGELRMVEVENNSYASNNVFVVEVVNVFDHNSAKVEIINLNGQVVATSSFDVNDGRIDGRMDIADLNTGIYIVNITSDKGSISTQKVMIQ